METWPTDLPKPTVAFANATDSSVVRSTMETGRVRQRRRFSRGNRRLSATWSLDDTQVALLQGFHEHTLNGGADWFTVELYLGDGAATQTVRFVGGLEIRHSGVLHWDVSAALEMESASVWDADTTGAALLITLSGFSAFEDAVRLLDTAMAIIT